MISIIGGDETLSAKPRYIYKGLIDTDTAIILAREAYKQSLKVLGIFNTVDRSVNFYQSTLSKESILFHSRFKYLHIIEKRKMFTDRFDPNEKSSSIGVCTQVAEISLDIDSDILFAEIATIEAIIQRLGRLNRRYNLPRPFYLISVAKDMPYHKTEMDVGRKFAKRLEEVKNTPISEKYIHDLRKDLDTCDFQLKARSALWASSIETTPAPTRTSEGVSVILKSDLQKITSDIEINGKNAVLKLAEFIIPMSHIPNRVGSLQKFHGIRVVDDDLISYSSETGAKWIK